MLDKPSLTVRRIHQRIWSPLYQAARSFAETIRSEPSYTIQIDQFCLDRSIDYRDFLRVFKRLTGTTPVRFVQSHRIEKAKRLLARSDIAVASVCYDLGYDSVGTFTRTFSSLVGVSPKSFRLLTSRVRNWEMGWFLNELQGFMPRTDLTQEISGFLSATQATAALTFVGLFDSPIPTNGPLSGAAIIGRGRFNLKVGVRERPLFVLAVSFEADATPLDILFPDSDRVLVASTVLSPENIKTRAPINLHLRPMSDFDPAIVYALPGLIDERDS
jgi:AraC-like DNA-binding protein